MYRVPFDLRSATTVVDSQFLVQELLWVDPKVFVSESKSVIELMVYIHIIALIVPLTGASVRE